MSRWSGELLWYRLDECVPLIPIFPKHAQNEGNHSHSDNHQISRSTQLWISPSTVASYSCSLTVSLSKKVFA
jgi:hypothetical protein